MQVHQIHRTATAAWCNIKGRPLLATGTLVGTMTENFDPTGTLELFTIDYKKKVVEEPVARIITDEKFYKLAWSGAGSVNGAEEELGYLAGGMESGVIGLWSASAVLSGTSTPLATKQKHVGAVRGLDFSPFQSSLLASGGSGGEVFVWDLATMSAVPPSPDSKGPAGDSELTSVAWNRQARHILGTSANNGITVIWDLRTKRSALNFSDPSSPGSRCSSLVWDPNSPVDLVTTIDDELHPVVLSWDLRNYLSPTAILKGHTAGVLSSSWCPQDHDLIATSGKDGKSIVWDIKKHALVSEVSSSSWNFDVQWSPTLACIVSSCNVGGQISLNSFHDFPGSGTSAVARTWLKRPVSVSFAFGGQLVSVPGQTPGKAAPVEVRTITIKDQELSTRAKKLYTAISEQSYIEFCDFKIQQYTESKNTENGGALVWEYLKLLFQEDPRCALLQNLGFHPDQLTKEVGSFLESQKETKDEEPPAASVGTSSEIVESVESKSVESKSADTTSGLDSFFEGGEETFDFGSITAPKPSTPESQQQEKQEPLPKIDFQPTDPVEKLITKCILVGNFEHAVDSCFGCGRISDALVLANFGGPELLKNTQRRYLSSQKRSYMQLLSLIIKKEYAELIRQSDLADWKEVLAILCAWTEGTQFPSLCEQLGDRLYVENQDISSALLAYVCAGNMDKAAALWMKEEISSNNSLQTFMERVVIFSHALKLSSPGSTLSTYYTQYAERLAGQGEVDIALAFLEPMKNEKDTPASILYNRINPTPAPVTATPKNTPVAKTPTPTTSSGTTRVLTAGPPTVGVTGFAAPSTPSTAPVVASTARGLFPAPAASSGISTFTPSSTGVSTFTPSTSATTPVTSSPAAGFTPSRPGPGFVPSPSTFTPSSGSPFTPSTFTPAPASTPVTFTPSTTRTFAPNEGRDPSRSAALGYTPPPRSGPVNTSTPSTPTPGYSSVSPGTFTPAVSRTSPSVVLPPTTVSGTPAGYTPPARGTTAGSTIIPPPSFVSASSTVTGSGSTAPPARGGAVVRPPVTSAVVLPPTTVSTGGTAVVAPPPRVGATSGYAPPPASTAPSTVTPVAPPPKKEEPVAPPPPGAAKRRVVPPTEPEEELVDGTDTAQRLLAFASQVAAYEQTASEMWDISPRLAEFAEKASNKAYPATVMLLIDELLIALSQRDFALADKLYSSLSQSHYALVGPPAMIGLKKFKALVSQF